MGVLNAVSSVSLFVRVYSACVSLDIMAFELFLGCSTTLASSVYDSLTRSETRRLLNATVSARSERTAHELLSLVCDAVITIDGSLCLEAPCPALDALLFNTSCRPFVAVNFTGLICDNDTDRFRGFISDFVRPQSMHLHLRDASGGRVASQLFHPRLERLGGHFSHVIGICEEPEVHFMRQLPHDVHAVPTTRLAQRSTLSEELVSLSSGESDCLRCACTVDLRHENLPLLDSSPCFTAIVGPVSGGRFRDWIVGDAQPFIVWLVRCANDFAHGGVDPLPFEHLVLHPPHRRKLNPICAVCHAREAPESIAHNEEEDEDDPLPIRIVLTNVTTKKRKKNRHIASVGTPPVRKVRLSM